MVNPASTMTLCLSLCVGGGFWMALFGGDDSLQNMAAVSAIIGTGMGPIYASGLLWMER